MIWLFETWLGLALGLIWFGLGWSRLAMGWFRGGYAFTLVLFGLALYLFFIAFAALRSLFFFL